MNISCILSSTTWYPGDRHFYSCSISKADLSTSPSFNLIYEHNQPKCDDDVKALAIIESKLKHFPRQINETFKNITIICIKQCNLSAISRDDLINFENLVELWLPNNKLRSLPGDLFVNNTKLERISFSSNKLESIDGEILDALAHLKFANFKRNPKIDAIYGGEKNITLSQLKQLIKATSGNATKIDKTVQTIERTFDNDLNKFLFNENFKDFDIKGMCRTFKVHKFVIAARSPIVCDMIEKNAALKGIALTNTTDNCIEMILDYMYDDEMPLGENFDENLKIYDLSLKLRLTEVTEHAAKEIQKKITKENAVEVLETAGKHKDTQMMSAAFEVIKEIFPNRKFKSNLLNDCVKVKKLIDELKSYWRALDEAAGKFSNLKFFDDESSEMSSVLSSDNRYRFVTQRERIVSNGLKSDASGNALIGGNVASGSSDQNTMTNGLNNYFSNGLNNLTNNGLNSNLNNEFISHENKDVNSQINTGLTDIISGGFNKTLNNVHKSTIDTTFIDTVGNFAQSTNKISFKNAHNYKPQSDTERYGLNGDSSSILQQSPVAFTNSTRNTLGSGINDLISGAFSPNFVQNTNKNSFDGEIQSESDKNDLNSKNQNTNVNKVNETIKNTIVSSKNDENNANEAINNDFQGNFNNFVKTTQKSTILNNILHETAISSESFHQTSDSSSSHSSYSQNRVTQKLLTTTNDGANVFVGQMQSVRSYRSFINDDDDEVSDGYGEVNRDAIGFRI